ncbi:serine/threonine-protein kinase [Fontivita pretiosa]|uniref:serine/threonine-protein kinase n=1 Tax=Fontivita pretiosa TaxID=2989684 RepID=UPI003D164587
MPGANQRISEYVLEQRLGGGTFGEVWRAHHHVWVDQLVAIKIPTDVQYVRNLQHEGSAIHGLVHPNIVRAIGFDPYANPPYLVMEYVPGTSLRPLIAERKIDIDDVVRIMRQVLAGLAHAHQHGVVHRDIKPENILIHERAHTDGFDAEGVVKVTDFGLGQAATRTAVGSIAYSASLNDPVARDIAGTLDYMAPEQRSGAEVDRRADIYACGVILYEMLTGERPAGTDLPSDLNRSVPKYLDEAFRRSYARLDKRFESAEQFLVALTPPASSASAASFGATLAAAATARTLCPSCRRAVDPADQFCMHCGVQLVSHVRRCPRCGAYPDRADRFCIFCGEALTEATGALANGQ